MFKAIADYYRLIKAGTTLARHDVLIPSDIRRHLPWPGKLVGMVLRLFSGSSKKKSTGDRLASALEKMGPAYVKLGQILATRPDIIGIKNAQDLSRLKDRVPPFSVALAEKALKAEFGDECSTLFPQLDAPIAAASISQVHKIHTEDGYKALKILRPDVEKHIEKELRALRRLARMIEKFVPDSRRLRPIDAVETIARSLTLELDLRFEAGAASEFKEVLKIDNYAGAPEVDWKRTSKRVLTTEWISGQAMTRLEGISDKDREALAYKVNRSFLASALDHGFFHADIHEGNMILHPPEKDGDEYELTFIDFGIMGRIGPNERLFLAEIINGFLTRNYTRLARVHFENGYVPAEHSMDDFAQALRSVGEPIHGQTAEDLPMGRIIMQLFDITEQFGMRMRPELVLIQKTMVQVEGVARAIYPPHDIWESARPIVERWVAREFGPVGAAKLAQNVANEATNRIKRLPEFMDRVDNALIQIENPPTPIKPRSNWPLWTVTLILGKALAALIGYLVGIHV